MCAAGILAALAAVPTSARARLEQLTRLPQVGFGAGVEFHPLWGYRLVNPGTGSPRQIESLGRRLQENPGEVSLYVQLADLLAGTGNRRAGEALLARAAELSQRQGAEDTADAERLTAYAEVLLRLGRWDEAERTLRQAVQAAPEGWRPSAHLARLLSARALGQVWSAVADPRAGFGSEALQRGDFSGPVEPVAAEAARRLMTEAQTLAERAVSLGPEQAEAYRGRATVRANQRLLEARLTRRGPENDPPPYLEAIFRSEALTDLRRAAALEPDAPEAHGCRALVEAIVGAGPPIAAGLNDLLNRRLWSALPEESRAAVRAALGQLERLGQSPDPRPASAALGTAGLVQFFLVEDTAGGLASLRRAVALDPDNDPAWEALTFALAFSREYAELLTVCRGRLEHRDTPRARLLLAKALEKNGQLEAMVAEAGELQRRFSQDALAHLTLAAALLKTDHSELGLARAQQHLGRAARLAGDRPAPELAVELLFQRGLWFALAGQLEQARTQFRGVLELVPEHPEASEALSLLDQFGAAED